MRGRFSHLHSLKIGVPKYLRTCFECWSVLVELRLTAITHAVKCSDQPFWFALQGIDRLIRHNWSGCGRHQDVSDPLVSEPLAPIEEVSSGYCVVVAPHMVEGLPLRCRTDSARFAEDCNELRIIQHVKNLPDARAIASPVARIKTCHDCAHESTQDSCANFLYCTDVRLLDDRQVSGVKVFQQ
jgi:hypothetical protein